ncbi:hypothetical protein PP505_gp61 [Gordonia phage Dorito]|uniref:Uncharacterized protein n=3 Tax=Caudoviricetes TaxID=2731619 RepID=A0A0U4IAA2_9CAUD|nr:hypothetical protein PP505_gp61 [Gordonia phage Dorito]YP_010654385.1 hypothetical protein PP506_gp63 [Gordonia phage DobbysSock]YP_010654929.1 hypothetical protein PP513_gp68 [Gordonia phage Howe]AZF93253.1 hypothetical protein SEA_ADORA_65 [Gordonia phage Adora]QDF16848.1 hypothetical protein SEA_TWINKLE_67 [Gordonia phage Twinkle]QYC54467.1 hypothetical protein SEA_SHLIM410_66 [Gordonia phage Shlim410]UAJ16317.1 hypothetical protein SEA_HORTENSE_68 [Gordonia phage Hortense]ALY07702.1 h
MNPRPTDTELRILDHLDQLTTVMATAVRNGDGETFLDALTESQFVERRLMESRESTWAIWFSTVSSTRREAA